MKRGLFTISVVLVVASQIRADFAMPIYTPLDRTAMSECIIIGKVTEIEKELTTVPVTANGKETVSFQVASVKIAEGLVGAKGLTQIRVAWQPVQENLPRRRPLAYTVPKEGAEGCWFLMKHPTGDFYTMIPWVFTLAKTEEKTIDEVRKACKVFDDPLAALRVQDATAREQAAVALLKRYRTTKYSYLGVPFETEPIAAEESKLILKILADMEWMKAGPDGLPRGLSTMFFQLGLTEKEGWKAPPNDGMGDYNKKLETAVKAWLKENAEKFQLSRIVPAKPKK